jgi:hypothetical protein
MEEALRALLIGHAPLTDLVTPDSIVWNHLPQSVARPAIVLFKIAGVPGLTQQGSDGLEGAVVQIDVQATTVEGMWAIKRALMALLHSHRSAALPGIFARAERQSSEELAGIGLIHRASLDFNVWAPA